ncbi:hypothetical protein [Exiguobacterium artemiae]|uniref:hypothetical protein n=1 Tax=Exiguobacterium artemiae TaxID=340145 RepID=UPI002964DA90|nr:hypothetical protein [Exiguobacterium sibiricum]MDW2886686.1 hypothetical protein [Exiguobacterium sibiricum]
MDTLSGSVNVADHSCHDRDSSITSQPCNITCCDIGFDLIGVTAMRYTLNTFGEAPVQLWPVADPLDVPSSLMDQSG